MSKIVYFDDEMNRIYQEIKASNPEWNFSGFVKNMMKEYNGDQEKIDEEKIKFQIVSAENEITQIKTKIDYLKKKLEAGKEREQQENELMKKEIDDTADSILRHCKVTKKEAKDLAKLWIPKKHNISLTLFLDEEGVEMRPMVRKS